MKGTGVSLAAYPSYHASFVFCHGSCLKNESCIFNFLAQPGILCYSFKSQTATLQPTERWKQRYEWALPVPMQQKFHSGESQFNIFPKTSLKGSSRMLWARHPRDMTLFHFHHPSVKRAFLYPHVTGDSPVKSERVHTMWATLSGSADIWTQLFLHLKSAYIPLNTLSFC